MGDESSVMKLLMEMLTYLEDYPGREEWCPEVGGGGGERPLSPPVGPDLSRPPDPCSPWTDIADDDDDYPPPTSTRPRAVTLAMRHRVRDQRRRTLRLAREKLAAIEERELTQRKEKDLRQQILLTNMSSRLEAEARAEKSARLTPRPARAYSRTLGRSFCSRPLTPTSSASSASATPTVTSSAQTSAAQERKKRRRACDSQDDLLGADIRDLLGEFGPPSPPSPADDDDEAFTKRLRMFPFGCCENSDPNGCGFESRSPQDQVRLLNGAEPDQVRLSGGERVGCGASSGFSDLQWSFHQLVPSLES